jgi:hypothetical protein
MAMACEAATMRHLFAAFSIGLAVGAGAPMCAIAEQPGAAPPPADQQIYRPTIADLMNDVIQPRHIKLWFAAQNQNWTLAEYERHIIGGAFSRIATAIPTDKGTQVADLITTFVTPHLTALEKSIKAQDKNAFTAAYGAFTQGCNECHQTTNRPVVIRSPVGNPYADQDFDPISPSLK